ncbi:histidine kinase-like protein [Haloactinospora alba]|uniref:Histidine kinase-like protein n=1 Tax=Haloactinospora alba TaxID=405555 RepID=A0A543NKZ6_9ACTN|nr:histidine kinase-like protein [Haloactinospora alba]
MARLAPVPPMPEATVPLDLLIPAGHEYYFNRSPDRPYFSARRFTFRGSPVVMPLVRAFLDTCAAAQSEEYRYLFRLLGGELAANAITHTRSGEPGRTFTLKVRRGASRMEVVCRDGGTPGGEPRYLAAAVPHERLESESGRGLALVEQLASAWGDNAHPTLRRVWFCLDYDLTGSAWPAA